jgi:hypothetical protein
MKLIKIAMGMFTLFLLYNPGIYASITSDLKHTIQYVVSHPIQSAKVGCVIGVKGFITIYAGYHAYLKASKCLRYFCNGNIKFDIESLKSPFKTSLMWAGLTLVAYECGNGLIADIKELK